MKHGRAVMPFGKYKGVHVRNVPDVYLSWLVNQEWIREPKWRWLAESIAAEFKHRDLHLEPIRFVSETKGFRDLMASLFDDNNEPLEGERKVRKFEEFKGENNADSK